MSPNLIIWFVGAFFASMLLLTMMRRRQAELHGILKEYVQVKLDWARKKAKTARLTRIAARDAEEKELALEQKKLDLQQLASAVEATAADSLAETADEEQPV